MSGVTTVSFEGEQTIRTVAEAAERLRAAMATDTAVAIDCEAVTELDLSFVQLLLSARKTALRNGRELALTVPAGGVLQACLQAGGFLHDRSQAPQSPDEDFWMKRGNA